MMYTAFVCVAAYIATNIDDMFINIFLYSQTKRGKDGLSILAGKYLGTASLVAFSCLGAYGAQTFLGQYLPFLGLVPVFLGVKEILSASGGDDDSLPAASGRFVWTTAVLTVANGADNIGVYLPLFATFGKGQMAVMAAVFTVMTALWCLAAAKLAALPSVSNIMKKHSRAIVPAVYICLGLYILLF